MSVHTLIVGGGIAGVRVAHILGKHIGNKDMKVTLVDREPVFTYNQLACALRAKYSYGDHPIKSHEIGIPYERVLDGTGVRFVKNSVEQIGSGSSSSANRWNVSMKDGQHINADVLAVCLGSEPRIGMISGGKQHMFGVHTIHDALQLRYHIESLFVKHATSPKRIQKEAWTVVVVGGGVTGVETAARLQLFLRVLARKYHGDESIPRVILCESQKSILRELPAVHRRRAQDLLSSLGVSVRVNHPITRVESHYAETVAHDDIPTHTTVWAGGIHGNDALLRSNFALHDQCGLSVEETLLVRDTANVFAAGSAACIINKDSGKRYPDTVWGAIWSANVAAENILRTSTDHAPIMYQPSGKPYVPSPPFSGFHAGWPVDVWVLSSVLPNLATYNLWKKGVTIK